MKLLLNQARCHCHFYSSSRCLQVRWFSSDPNATTARVEHPGSLGATPLQQSPRLPPSENMHSLLDFAGISGYGVFVEALEGQHYPYVSGSEKPSALSTCNWYHSILRSHPLSTPPRYGNFFATQFSSFSMLLGEQGAGKAEVTSNTMNTLRPLSPHLPVYQPQLNSTISIFNRISAASITTMVLVSYLLV